MEIVWLGHSCIRLRSRRVTLIADPYLDALGFPMARQKADIVTISNDHPHHSYLDAVENGEGVPRVLRGPGQYETAGFYIIGIGTSLGEYEGERKVNTVFTIQAEDLTLCHLGDLNQRLSPGQVEELRQTDVLFVPAGGTCTISPGEVAELINLIAPRIVVPLHYRTEGVNIELEALDGFLGEMGVTEVDAQVRLNVTSTNIPRELQVAVLKRAE